MRDSLPFVIERALQMGLPVVAVFVATVPIWGMSWYFNSENWAAGVYNSWAEHRTDTWRVAMTRAVLASAPSARPAAALALEPPGTGGDFSFLVIGDPGEGDASQHVLRDQILTAAARDDVKFIVISSDVIYPTGAMKDYEANFWLPLKGTRQAGLRDPGQPRLVRRARSASRPPSSTPEAAARAMRARVVADNRITTHDRRPHRGADRQGRRLRTQYGVPTGFQRAPFFDVQTDELRPDRRRHRRGTHAWTRCSGGGSSGARRVARQVVMVVLGHPFYAGGAYLAASGEPLPSLHDLLKRARRSPS